MSDILTLFPQQELSPITSTNERPNYASLVHLQQQLYANALSIPSTRGQGTDGHLNVVTLDARYLAITTEMRSLPANPGPDPALPVRMATRESPHTADEFAKARRVHTRNLLAFQTCATVKSLLKRQLLQTVPSTFLFETMDVELGYAQVSTLGLLEHLYLNYGIVTANELSTNMDNLSRKWDADQQLEDLWAQITRCAAFAKDHDPITEKTILRVTINNLKKSGVFTQAIQDWRKMREADHTITNMKVSFNLANKECIRSLSSSAAGFAGRVITNKENRTPQINPAVPNGPYSLAQNPMGFYYCWSHRLLLSRENHSSSTCRSRSPGHKEDATARNMVGGNNTIHCRTNQPAIYCAPCNAASI
jgi:hypothetical protein